VFPRLAFSVTLLLTAAVFTACANKPSPAVEDARTKQIESHYRLGLDALEKNNLPKAFEELLRAEKLGPRHADVLAALGYAWNLRGDLQKSYDYYNRSLAINPAARTLNNYGTLLLSMHKPKEAEAAFRKALEDPRYDRPDYAYINLGDALLMQERLDDAIAAYRQARLLNPRQELSRLKEAAAYSSHNRPAFARAMYETILRERPANRQALEGLIQLLQNQFETAEARRQLQHFIKVTPEPLDRAWAEETLKAMQP